MVADISKELSLSEEQGKQASYLYFVQFKEVSEQIEEHKSAREKQHKEMEKLRDYQFTHEAISKDCFCHPELAQDLQLNRISGKPNPSLIQDKIK